MSRLIYIPDGLDFNDIPLENLFSKNRNTDVNNDNLIINEESSQSRLQQVDLFKSYMTEHIEADLVFKYLINACAPIDFILEAGGDIVLDLRDMLNKAVDSKTRSSIENNIKKHEPSLLDKNVIIIRYLLKLAREKGYGIGTFNMVPYVYNGKIWKKQSVETVTSFLAIFSIKAGLRDIEANQFKQKENITKQFFSDSEIPQFSDVGTEVKIPLLNCILLINNGVTEIVDFDMKYFLRYQLPYEYNPTAKAPLFTKTLNRILPDNILQYILFEFFGYVFAKNLKLEKMLVLLGPGGNGKSVISAIMKAVFGKENVTSFTIESLCEPKSTTRALINGKLLNYSSEANFGKFDIDTFKKLVSNESTEARHLFKDSMIIEDYSRFCLNCNVLPKNIENSDAFYRRFLILPFVAKISEEEKDVELSDKIISTELPGILNLILEGMERLIRQKGFTKSTIVNNLSSNFRKESNSLLTWLDEEMYSPYKTQKMRVIDFYQLYKEFCKDGGFIPLNNNNFKTQLRNAGFEIVRSTNGYYHVFYEKIIPGIDDSAIVIKPSLDL